MNINIKLDKDFSNTITQLIDNYGQKMAALNGFADSQLSYTDFIDNFIDSVTIADASIDGSANVARKTTTTLVNEMAKPTQKLLAFNKIFYEMNKKYGFHAARAFLESDYTGKMYLHDANTSTFFSYCFAYDLKDLAERGLFFIDNFNNEPPKHLGTFVDFVKEFVSFCANSTSGAVGMPNLIPYMYYFWDRDIKNHYYTETPEAYAKQNIQRLIYALNQPFLRGNIQSSFTNTSIFDHPYLEALFGGSEFPDGEAMIDEIEGIMNFQKLFLETMSTIRSKNMMTYPVNSISLLRQNGKFIDEEFAKYAIRHNMKWCDSNLFIDSSVSSLSNCPLSPDTKILYWLEDEKQFKLAPIEEVYSIMEKEAIKNIEVLSNGKRIKCKINKFNIAPDYEITLANSAKIRTTANHLNKTRRGNEIKTEDLTVDDYLPYGRHAFKESRALTYEEGLLVGAFLREGSRYNPDEAAIDFFLKSDTDEDFINLLKSSLLPNQFGISCSFSFEEPDFCNQRHVIAHCTSQYLYGLIQQCVDCDKLNKAINMRVLNYSKKFRQGIIDGLNQFDGEDSYIATSSKNLMESVVALFASLGLTTQVDENSGRYIIKYYTPHSQPSEMCVMDDDYLWVKIASITHCDTQDNTSYCLEVLGNSAPYFTLGNGIITHNCRLKSDIKELYFNSIGGTALKVGSVKVNTINLARIAYESKKNEQEYLNILRDRTLLCCQVLDVVRSIIQRNVEKGLMKNFSSGMIDFQHLYNTCGVLGVFEALKYFGYTKTDEFGYVSYTDDAYRFGKQIFDTIIQVKNEFAKTRDYIINIESVPGESAAAKLQKKDLFFFPNDADCSLPLYGNQFMPLGIRASLKERVKAAAAFDSYCNGGSILHANLDAPIEDFTVMWNLVNYIADAGVTYFAFCTKISSCDSNHGFYGNICPECGKPKTGTYSRIVGFLTKTSTYSKERKAEFERRQWEK